MGIKLALSIEDNNKKLLKILDFEILLFEK